MHPATASARFALPVRWRDALAGGLPERQPSDARHRPAAASGSG
jgi:hypothetical protein